MDESSFNCGEENGNIKGANSPRLITRSTRNEIDNIHKPEGCITKEYPHDSRLYLDTDNEAKKKERTHKQHHHKHDHRYEHEHTKQKKQHMHNHHHTHDHKYKHEHKHKHTNHKKRTLMEGSECHKEEHRNVVQQDDDVSMEEEIFYEEKKEIKVVESPQFVPFFSPNEIRASNENTSSGHMISSWRGSDERPGAAALVNQAQKDDAVIVEAGVLFEDENEVKVVDSPQLGTFFSPNTKIQASHSGRKTVQDLEAKDRIDIEYPGTSGCRPVVTSTSGEDASPRAAALGSQGHRPDTIEERQSEDQHPNVTRARRRWIHESVIPGSVRVTNIDDEEGSEEDERTIVYRMGTESVHSNVSSRGNDPEEENQQVQERIHQNECPKAVVAQFISNIERRCIIASAVLLSIVVAAVAAGFVLSSWRSDGDGGFDQCNFTDIGQLMQCECNQEILKRSEDVYLRYQDLLSTVIPEVKPDFAELETSCAPTVVILPLSGWRRTTIPRPRQILPR